MTIMKMFSTLNSDPLPLEDIKKGFHKERTTKHRYAR